MCADFWAGYVSGAVGIVIGNPLDLIKVRLQARHAIDTQVPSAYIRQFESTASLVSGTAAPILGYGALNALLFVSYNRTEVSLSQALSLQQNLWTTWIAGAVGGLATWVVSTPTELIKCRAQVACPPLSSLEVARRVLRTEGIRGLYFGGVVTALRDSIGYGFYFWSYEMGKRWLATSPDRQIGLHHEAANVLLCGGVAGVVTWASIFPLDVIKTRVQTQALGHEAGTSPLVQSSASVATSRCRVGAIQVAKDIYQEGGMRLFFRGLAICSVRAFIVNAVQWAVYEWMMYELGRNKKQRSVNET